jgi:hypothetical protein
MTEWTSAKLVRFIRDILDKQPDLEARPDFRKYTGILVKQGEEKFSIVIEPIK